MRFTDTVYKMRKSKILLTGACGKMGMRIAVLLQDCGDMMIECAAEAEGHPAIGREYEGGKSGILVSALSLDAARECDIVMDFSSTNGFNDAIDIAAELGIPFLSGTTGLTADDKEKLREAANAVAVLYSPNMSIGVNLLFSTIGPLAKAAKGFEIDIIETHHNKKKDAPSGTALKLGEIIELSGGGKVNYHSLRCGDVAGDHTIVFSGEGERIEITHRAHSRDCLVSGAIKAARWLLTKKKGLYSMKDVLGL